MKGIEAIKGFKEKHGPVKKELLEWVKYTNQSMAAIRKALKDGPLTVPAAAAAAKMDPADVLWFLNAMRKYGEAVITGDESGYKKYGLKENAK